MDMLTDKRFLIGLAVGALIVPRVWKVVQENLGARAKTVATA